MRESVNPHREGSCQVCDMFENIGHWGPTVGLVPAHIREPWPDVEGHNWLGDHNGNPDWHPSHEPPDADGVDFWDDRTNPGG